MELYRKGSDLNFNFAETFDANKTTTKCVIILSESCEGLSDSDTMSYKQRNQANARERCRTHRYWFSKILDPWKSICGATKKLICQSSTFSVNSAFNTLRLLIPTEPKNRKLSKIETLRLAKSYISHLSATLLIGELLRRWKTFNNCRKNDLSSIGNSLCRQPCFEIPNKNRENHRLDYRTNICTFCVSSVIHQKRIN